MAATMESTLALSRPSEKLGTHSTSVDIRQEHSWDGARQARFRGVFASLLFAPYWELGWQLASSPELSAISFARQTRSRQWQHGSLRQKTGLRARAFHAARCCRRRVREKIRRR